MQEIKTMTNEALKRSHETIKEHASIYKNLGFHTTSFTKRMHEIENEIQRRNDQKQTFNDSNLKDEDICTVSEFNQLYMQNLPDEPMEKFEELLKRLKKLRDECVSLNLQNSQKYSDAVSILIEMNGIIVKYHLEKEKEHPEKFSSIKENIFRDFEFENDLDAVNQTIEIAEQVLNKFKEDIYLQEANDIYNKFNHYVSWSFHYIDI